MFATGPQLLNRAALWGGREALVAGGQTYTYAQLLHSCLSAAARLLGGFPAPPKHHLAPLEGTGTPGSAPRDAGPRADLREARVVFLAPPGAQYVVAQWAIWAAGGVAVPLASSQAPAEWDYIVEDTRPTVVLGGGAAEATLRAIAERHGAHHMSLRAIELQPDSDVVPPLPGIDRDRAGLILYTSGTTSRPKGVVTTHANIEAQIGALVEAWRWTEDDRILHVLPLNHVHGIINLSCALWSGACCEFLSPFDATAAWDRFAGGGLTLFMAVPTIYAKLAAAFDAADDASRARWAEGAASLRLMVSGSAALPVTMLDRWRRTTGHVLLERYGMTEIGMALSNPLDGTRRPGCVGVPLPGVGVRLVDDLGRPVADGLPGEVEVRGPNVFREYWRRPDATREAFRDGWFRTGDMALMENGSYRLLGRVSVDIIKTGGYKVSALEIEEVLRDHPAVAECAVVGLPDDEWGERVAAAVVPRVPAPVSLNALREWASPRLAKYKLPTRLAIVESLPRNAMGKVVKNEVKRVFRSGQQTDGRKPPADS
jgi:malonyl-CoA/methylmalonyl-CoA synthetase